MFNVLWKNFAYPCGDNLEYKLFSIRCFSPEIHIENVRSFAYSNKQLLGKFGSASRSCSRACCLLHFACSLMPDDCLEIIGKNPFRTGIYCAIENGSVDYNIVEKILAKDRNEFHVNFKRERNPKMYLKQLPNLAAAQLGISYNVRGPLYVFTHTKFGPSHALEQAEFDLLTNQIDYALVVSAFSDEDGLNLLKNMTEGGLPISEGAAAVLLQRGEDRSTLCRAPKLKYNYGISCQLIDKFGFTEEEYCER